MIFELGFSKQKNSKEHLRISIVLFKHFITKKINIIPGLQRMFHLVLEPVRCWHWSSNVVLSQYHQHNDANSPEPMNAQFWIQHLEQISTWGKIYASGIGFLFLYGNKKLISHTIKGIYSENHKRLQSWLLPSPLPNKSYSI